MDQPRISLRADYVIGYRGDGHVLFSPGEVVFKGGVIEFAGRRFPGRVDRSIDYGRAMIGPGFVDLDALGDIDSTVLTFDGGSEAEVGQIVTEDYLRSGLSDAYTLEENIAKYRHAFAGLIANGITSAMPITGMSYREWAESYEEMAGVAEIAGRYGLRCWLGPCYRTGLTYQRRDASLARHYDEPRGLEGLEQAIRFARDFHGAHGGLVSAALLPDRIETCTERLLERTAAAARELGAPVRLHCCQSVYDFETVLAASGTTPYGLLERVGLMGPRSILPHGIYVSGHPKVSLGGQEDVERLRSSGATVLHCPVVFARDGEGLDSFARYLRLGINVALGTDTHPPDLIDNMRLGLTAARLLEGRREAGSVADLYSAATLGGAKALGRSDIGRLAAGARADITVFDLSARHIGPIVDPVRTMVLAGSEQDFIASFIDGRPVMEAGKLIGIDEAELIALADRLNAKLTAAYPARAPGRPPVEQLFRPTFPMARE
ncbi:MAG: chlorohydrolase family protein [Hyphomicrobiaceae bacterium]